VSNYSVYNNSGKIVRSISAPPNMLGLQPLSLGESIINAKANLETDYIPNPANPVVTPRPANPTTLDKTTVTADGVDKAIASGVPLNSVITLTDSTGSITTGTATTSSIDLIFDIAGTYTIRVELFPYLDFEATINAT